MTKPILLAAAAVLAFSASAPASAQYFPLGNVLNSLGNAAPPPPETRPKGRAPAMAPQKPGRPTHIIPPQSTRNAGARSYPRENSAPSEDND
jgi:hypothetical protein